MRKETRGSNDNLHTKLHIAALLEQKEPIVPSGMTLVRLTSPEYEQLFSLKEGSKVAVINLQHFNIHERLREFQIGINQYGVRITVGGRNTQNETREPVLDAKGPIIIMRLDAYHYGIDPTYTPNAKELDVDHIVLGSANTVLQLLRDKYATTMTVDFSTAKYYMRIFTILDTIQSSVQSE